MHVKPLRKVAVFAPQWEHTGAEQRWVAERDAQPGRAQRKAAGKEEPPGARAAQHARVQLKDNLRYPGRPPLSNGFSKSKYKL